MDFAKVAKKLIRLPAKAVVKKMDERAKEPKIIKREEKVNTLFKGKPYITRQWFRRALKRAPIYNPKTRIFSAKERVAMEKNLFPRKKFGYFISPWEYHKKIRELKKQRHYAKTWQEKEKLYKEIQFLKELEGKKDEK